MAEEYLNIGQRRCWRASTVGYLPTEVGALGGALLRLGVDFADQDFGAIERKAVEFVVKTLAVAMPPQSTDRSPDLLVAVLGDATRAATETAH
ncbi:hypothetical protein ACVWWO_004692 [Bradyrhizobium sp. F1.13.1]